MLRKTMVAAVIALVCGGALPAMAQESPSDALMKARDAVLSTGIDVAEQRTLIGPRGTEDMWLYSRDTYDATVKRFKAVFNERAALPGGFQIVAHARMVRSGDFNFTLRNATGETMLLQVRRDGKKAIARIEGRVRPDLRAASQAHPAKPRATMTEVDFTP